MEDSQKPVPPKVYDLEPVPVFDCQVILKRDTETNQITAVVANFAGIQVTGSSEPDVLRKIAEAYKNELRPYVEGKKEIPWIKPREMEADEFRRVLEGYRITE